MRRFFKLSLIATASTLTACAYAIDTSMQEITVETPGANDAICYALIDGIRHRVYPPQTLTITKSEKDMVVDCLAPGNRRKKVIVEPMFSDAAPLNLATGGATATWDYASKALFKYPDVIEIDFTGMPVVPSALPAHNNPDIRQPEDYDLEQFSPGKPRLNSDTNDPVEIRLRERERAQSSQQSFSNQNAFTESPSVSSSKGNLQAPSATTSPTPLYPGQ